LGAKHRHSPIWNLHSVPAEDRDAGPAPTSRTIRDIVEHMGTVFLKYESHVFGDGTQGWNETAIDRVAPGKDAAAMISWLREVTPGSARPWPV
jgi:hypothetical protein